MPACVPGVAAVQGAVSRGRRRAGVRFPRGRRRAGVSDDGADVEPARGPGSTSAPWCDGAAPVRNRWSAPGWGSRRRTGRAGRPGPPAAWVRCRPCCPCCPCRRRAGPVGSARSRPSRPCRRRAGPAGPAAWERSPRLPRGRPGRATGAPRPRVRGCLAVGGSGGCLAVGGSGGCLAVGGSGGRSRGCAGRCSRGRTARCSRRCRDPRARAVRHRRRDPEAAEQQRSGRSRADPDPTEVPAAVVLSFVLHGVSPSSSSGPGGPATRTTVELESEAGLKHSGCPAGSRLRAGGADLRCPP